MMWNSTVFFFDDCFFFFCFCRLKMLPFWVFRPVGMVFAVVVLHKHSKMNTGEVSDFFFCRLKMLPFLVFWLVGMVFAVVVLHKHSKMNTGEVTHFFFFFFFFFFLFVYELQHKLQVYVNGLVSSFRLAVPGDLPTPDADLMSKIIDEHRHFAQTNMDLVCLDHGRDAYKRADFAQLCDAKHIASLNVACEVLFSKLRASDEVEILIFRLPDSLISLLPTMLLFYITSKTPFILLFFPKFLF